MPFTLATASSETQDAVMRNLQILAESSKRLSARLKEAHSEIEWPKVAGFRNVLVHDYMGLNLRRIWEIIRDDLPPLKRTIAAMLAELPEVS